MSVLDRCSEAAHDAARWLYLRLALLLAPQRALRERGDSPVPTSIIIAGLAALAAVVVAWAVSKANDAMNTHP
jgi:hypothetical protein